MTRMRAAIAAMAILASAHAPVAAAQECVSEAEVADLFIYAMPSALNSARNSCSDRVQPNGFFSTGGASSLSSKYAALQAGSWPRAKRALLLMLANPRVQSEFQSSEVRNIDPNRLLNSLPDDVARPLVDAIIVEKVAANMKPEQCRNLERFASAIAPIEPRTAAVLIGTLMGLVEVKEPQICVADQ